MGIDIGKFLKNPEFDILITTYRDIFQVEALETDRFGEEYKKLSAVITMSKNDLKKMEFKSGDHVKLSNTYGSVIVEVKESKKNEPGGVAFMVNSPWSNCLISDETEGKGIPEFKHIKAKISLSKEQITQITEIIFHK
ncbi:MAG: formylmethanofuran dehydrogenase [Candidatus Methanoperedens sp.]|nr:formylmethanofuran dehydrogenase [Candidatus Methanoperedens sp.]